MKIFTTVIFLALSSLAFAEQPELSSEAMTSSQGEAAAEPSANGAPEKVADYPTLKCDHIFLEYLKREKAAVQDQNMKTYFAMDSQTGDEFMKDVEDEFKWPSKEKDYKKKYKELLAEKTNYLLRTNVRLGKYDFKKERFPLEFRTEKGNVLTYYSSGGIGGNDYTGSIKSCNNTSMAKTKFEIADIKVSNSKKQHYFNVSKELAEKITAKLRFDRQLDVQLTYVVEKSTGKLVPDYVDKKKKNLKMEIIGKITEIHFNFFNDDSLGKISTDLN